MEGVILDFRSVFPFWWAKYNECSCLDYTIKSDGVSWKFGWLFDTDLVIIIVLTWCKYVIHNFTNLMMQWRKFCGKIITVYQC